jgi:LAS superfamily LD-carboxypeptidase LdcB
MSELWNMKTAWQLFDKRLTTLRNEGLLTQASSMESLLSQLEPSEHALVHAFLAIKLEDYGITTPYLGLEETPDDLTVLHEGHPNSKVADYNTTKQYAPRTVAQAFEEMRIVYHRENPDRQLIVASAYRSPAFQIATLTSYFVHIHNFSIASTLTQVALPACSQHCSVTNTALDLANADGQPSDENGQDFADTPEYQWLKANAHRYGFHESYPPDNSDGIMWEPWHWQYLPETLPA